MIGVDRKSSTFNEVSEVAVKCALHYERSGDKNLRTLEFPVAYAFLLVGETP